MATPRYLPEMGGVERHVHEVAMRLAGSGEADVTILTTDRSGLLPSHERAGAVEVLRVRARPHDRDWLFAPGAAAVVARGAWDVMHVQSYHTLVAPTVMATAARRRLPYVLTFHGGGHSSPLRHRLRVAQRALLRPLLARAAALVAVAQFEIDEYAAELRLPKSRFALIPNGVDLPPAPGADDGESRAPGSGPLIASIGRLERYKGHQRVLAALPAVREVEPGAHLWIAGAGPYESELRRLAANLGVGDAVEISAVPPGDREQMARRLSQVDVVVLLSSFETHPIAALEALWLGRPVLVATGSGLGELAERGLARAIDPQSPPQQVAAAILRELRDPLAVVPAQLPTWDDCAAALLALYRRVLARAA
jgi:glycogen synthase